MTALITHLGTVLHALGIESTAVRPREARHFQRTEQHYVDLHRIRHKWPVIPPEPAAFMRSAACVRERHSSLLSMATT